MAALKLIVGLGNPGDEYTNTRHNAGFWLVEQIARKYQVNFKLEGKFFGLISKFSYLGSDVLLLKPQTYMNVSGKSIQAVTSFYKILPNEVLVAHDELDFEPGIAKLKLGGGNGGHNGLKDIDRVIGKDYWRLRLGIGHPGDRNKVVSYVLKKPLADELQAIFNAIDRFDTVLNLLLENKFNEAMKLLHTQ